MKFSYKYLQISHLAIGPATAIYTGSQRRTRFPNRENPALYFRMYRVRSLPGPTVTGLYFTANDRGKFSGGQ